MLVKRSCYRQLRRHRLNYHLRNKKEFLDSKRSINRRQFKEHFDSLVRQAFLPVVLLKRLKPSDIERVISPVRESKARPLSKRTTITSGGDSPVQMITRPRSGYTYKPVAKFVKPHSSLKDEATSSGNVVTKSVTHSTITTETIISSVSKPSNPTPLNDEEEFTAEELDAIFHQYESGNTQVTIFY